jgi:hydrogenase maturation factor
VCLGDAGRVVVVDPDAGTATVDVGERTITALLVALDDAGASLQPGDGVLVHLGIITEVLDDATTAELIRFRHLVLDPHSDSTTPPQVEAPT